jgi:hypothetical protein
MQLKTSNCFFAGILLLAGSCTTAPKKVSSGEALIRDCPEEKIINRMPTTGGSGRPDGYFIYKGQRAEVATFDTAWIRANCQVKETEVF